MSQRCPGHDNASLQQYQSWPGAEYPALEIVKRPNKSVLRWMGLLWCEEKYEWEEKGEDRERDAASDL